MSVTSDIREASRRFPQHVNAFTEIFKKSQITNVTSAIAASKRPGLRKDVSALSQQIMQQEGGKITFALLLGIIGAALGGVGIAALGGAIGVPLAAIGTVAGLALGNEADSEGYTSALIRKIKAFKNG